MVANLAKWRINWVRVTSYIGFAVASPACIAVFGLDGQNIKKVTLAQCSSIVCKPCEVGAMSLLRKSSLKVVVCFNFSSSISFGARLAPEKMMTTYFIPSTLAVAVFMLGCISWVAYNSLGYRLWVQCLSDHVTSVGPHFKGPLEIYAQWNCYPNILLNRCRLRTKWGGFKFTWSCNSLRPLRLHEKLTTLALRALLPAESKYPMSTEVCFFPLVCFWALEPNCTWCFCCFSRHACGIERLNCPSEWNWSRLARPTADICWGVGHATILSFRCLSYISLSWTYQRFSYLFWDTIYKWFFLLSLSVSRRIYYKGKYPTTNFLSRILPLLMSSCRPQFVQLLFFFIRNQEISGEGWGEQDWKCHAATW